MSFEQHESASGQQRVMMSSRTRPLVMIPTESEDKSMEEISPSASIPTIIRTSPERDTELIRDDYEVVEHDPTFHKSENAGVHSDNPGHPSIRKTEYMYEDSEHIAEVARVSRDWGPFQELADRLSEVNTQVLGYFLALIYFSTMVSLIIGLDPSWLVIFNAIASLIMFRVFKL